MKSDEIEIDKTSQEHTRISEQSMEEQKKEQIIQIDYVKVLEEMMKQMNEKDNQIMRLGIQIRGLEDNEILLMTENEQLQDEANEYKWLYMDYLENKNKTTQEKQNDYQEKYQQISEMYNEQKKTVMMDQQLINELSQLNKDLKEQLKVAQNHANDKKMTQYNIYNNHQVICSTNIKLGNRKSDILQSFVSDSDQSGSKKNHQMQVLLDQKSQLIQELKETIDRQWIQIDEISEKNNNLNKLRCILQQKVKNLKNKLEIEMKCKQNERCEQEKVKVELMEQIKQYESRFEQMQKENEQLKKYNDGLQNQEKQKPLGSLLEVQDNNILDIQYINLSNQSILLENDRSNDQEYYHNQVYDNLKKRFSRTNKGIQCNLKEELGLEQELKLVKGKKSCKEKYSEKIYKDIKLIGEQLMDIDKDHDSIESMGLLYQKAMDFGGQMWKQYKLIAKLLLKQTLKQQIYQNGNILDCKIVDYDLVDGQQIYEVVLINDKMQKIWMMKPSFNQLQEFHMQLDPTMNFPKGLRFYQKSHENYQKQMSQIQDFISIVLISKMEFQQQKIIKEFLYNQIMNQVKLTFDGLESQFVMSSWESVKKKNNSFSSCLEDFHQQFMKLNQTYSKIKRDIEYLDESKLKQI